MNLIPEQLRDLEQHFAYEHVIGMLDGLTGPAPVDDYAGPIWHDLTDADCDLSSEVAYLDSRRLIDRHPSNPEWIQIREEHNPRGLDTDAVVQAVLA